jgi:SPP1 family predicted phage head-tail adaptor
VLWRDVINLISVATSENELGDLVETETPKQVFANKKSIRSGEFYQAQSTGLRPELMFEVKTIDYDHEPKLEHEGKAYTIIRTYDKSGEVTELICQGIVNGVM